MSKYLVCICGWISDAYPDDVLFAGPGGELVCLDCADAGRKNGALEGFGRVIDINEKDYWTIIASKERTKEIKRIIDREFEKAELARKIMIKLRRKEARKEEWEGIHSGKRR